MAKPVPIDDLPDDLRVPEDDLPADLAFSEEQVEELRQQLRAGQQPEVGRLEALSAGAKSGVPFANTAEALLTARTGRDRQLEQNPLIRRGMSRQTGADIQRAAEENAAYAEETRRQRELGHREAMENIEARNEAAWQQHPWFYGPGKALGLAGSAAVGGSLGAQGPRTALMGQTPTKLQQARTLADVGGRWGALYGASEAATPEETLREAAVQGATGAVATPALGAAAAGLGRASQDAAGALGRRIARGAQQNALRSMRAPGAVGQLASREGFQRPAEVAQAALDEPGIKLRSPLKIYEGARTAQQNRYGPEIGRVMAKADASGAEFNLQNVLSKWQSEIKPDMMKDPNQQPIANAVEEYLFKSAQARGTWTPEGRQLLSFKPSEAHGLRQNLDTYLYGVQDNLDPRGTLTRVPFNKLRQAVDDELGATVKRAGVDPGAWERANRGYQNMKAVEKLSKAGEVSAVRSEVQPASNAIRYRMRVGKLPIPFVYFGGQTVHPGRTAAKARIEDKLAKALQRYAAIGGNNPFPGGGVPVSVEEARLAGQAPVQPAQKTDMPPGFTLVRPNPAGPMPEVPAQLGGPAPAPQGPTSPVPGDLSRQLYADLFRPTEEIYKTYPALKPTARRVKALRKPKKE